VTSKYPLFRSHTRKRKSGKVITDCRHDRRPEGWEDEVLPTDASPVTRKGYGLNLRRLKPVFGPSTWGRISLPTLKLYLNKRTAKTQANREARPPRCGTTA
jgi:hypothetical protein